MESATAKESVPDDLPVVNISPDEMYQDLQGTIQLDLQLNHSQSHKENVLPAFDNLSNHQLPCGEITLICEFCDNTYNSERGLESHLSSYHRIVKRKLSCSSCGRKYLWPHKRELAHNNNRPSCAGNNTGSHCDLTDCENAGTILSNVVNDTHTTSEAANSGDVSTTYSNARTHDDVCTTKADAESLDDKDKSNGNTKDPDERKVSFSNENAPDHITVPPCISTDFDVSGVEPKIVTDANDQIASASSGVNALVNQTLSDTINCDAKSETYSTRTNPRYGCGAPVEARSLAVTNAFSPAGISLTSCEETYLDYKIVDTTTMTNCADGETTSTNTADLDTKDANSSGTASTLHASSSSTAMKNPGGLSSTNSCETYSVDDGGTTNEATSGGDENIELGNTTAHDVMSEASNNARNPEDLTVKSDKATIHDDGDTTSGIARNRKRRATTSLVVTYNDEQATSSVAENCGSTTTTADKEINCKTSRMSSRMQACDNEATPHQCHVCDKQFDTKAKCQNHVRYHRQRFKCDICGKVYLSNQKLKHHYYSHTQNYPFKCNLCKKGFAYKYVLVDHMHSIHADKPFACDFCSKSFAVERDLAKHGKCHKGAKPYICTICTKRFQDFTELKQHELSHSEKTFVCEICDKLYYSRGGLVTHIKKAHNGKKLSCKSCKLKFVVQSALRKHELTHLDGLLLPADPTANLENSGPNSSDTNVATIEGSSSPSKGNIPRTVLYKCPVCVKTFDSRKKMMNHARYHRPKTKKFACDLCSKVFVKNQTLKRHRYSHTQNYPFKCDVCGKKYAEKYDLNMHVRSAHATDRPFVCKDCGKSFTIAIHLTRHSKYHAGVKYLCKFCGKGYTNFYLFREHEKTHGEKTHVCDTCGKAFHTKWCFDVHLKTAHNPDKKFVCEICGKRFAMRSWLNLHHASHGNERKHKCCQCGMGFKTRISLRYHKKVHSNERPFECKTCGMKFKCKDGLSGHVARHAGVKPHQCDTCGKSFTEKGSLIRHKRTHSGERPYKCKVCGKSYIESYPLTLHLKTHVEDDYE